MDSKKPILIFAVNDLLVGGVQRLYIDLCKQGFPEYEVHLVTLFKFPSKHEWFDAVPSQVVVHQFNFKNFRDMSEWVRLARLLRRLGPAVIVSSLFFSNTVTRVLGFCMRIPVIAIEHNTYTGKTPNQQRVDRLLAHATYRIVAVSKTVLEFTARQERIPKEKFVLIHNGVDLAALDTAARAADPAATRAAIGLSSQQRLVVAVGRLTEQKNPEALIKGFIDFHTAHPEYVLALAGQGKLQESLKELITTHGAGGYIKLLGARNDVAALCRASDFFVSTSHIEGFGLAHAEALRCGIPVLTTKTAGPDEMIIEGENGLFLQDGTPEAVARGLERMTTTTFSAPEHIAASVERFSIIKAAAAYRALIAQTINRHA